MKKEQLAHAADELNALLFATPEIPTKGDVKLIADKIVEAATLLEPEDKLSAITLETLAELGVPGYAPVEAKDEIANDVVAETVDDVVVDDQIPEHFEKATKLLKTPKAANPKVIDGAYNDDGGKEKAKEDEEVAKEVFKKAKEFISKPKIKKIKKVKKVKVPKAAKVLSPYGIGVELMCKDPDVTVVELKEKVLEFCEIPKGNNGVRSAHIIVKKIVMLLRKNKLMK